MVSLKKGFTLVELLSVIAIIAVLSAILIPSIRGVLVSVKTTQCANNLRQIYAAVMMYAADNNGYYPSGHGNRLPGFGVNKDWQEALMYYVQFSNLVPRSGQTVDNALTEAMQRLHRNDSIFVCPADEDPPQLYTREGEEYNCYSYQGSVDTVVSHYAEARADTTAFFFDRRIDDPRLKGSMMLYADSSKTGRPTRYTNSWTPNRHGGPASPTNNGNETPRGTNNILFYDGHVEERTRDEIPASSSTVEAKRFWAPPHYDN